MGTGEAHRGTPCKVTIWGINGELQITAHLSQVHCQWPTDVYVDLDVRGLRHEYQVAQGTAAFPVDKLAALVEMLTDLAVTGQALAHGQSREARTTTHGSIAVKRSGSAGPKVRRRGEEVDR